MKSIIFVFALLTAASVFAAGTGEELFYSKCTGCHGSALSLNKTKTEKQWLDTIKKMKRHGLSINSAESKAVAKFLFGGN